MLWGFTSPRDIRSLSFSENQPLQRLREWDFYFAGRSEEEETSFRSPYTACLGYVLKPCNYNNKSLCTVPKGPTWEWPSCPMGNLASSSRACLLNHNILGQRVSMHGMDSLLTAAGSAPVCPSFFDLPREVRSPDWLPSTHPQYEIKWVRGILLALTEVAWHRLCPHCSILSLCKIRNIPGLHYPPNLLGEY